MKKVICMVLLLAILLCACDRQKDEVSSFSFDMESVEGTGSIRMIDAEGQKQVHYMNATKAVEIAKKYCTFGNAESSVDYDSEAGVYRIFFIQAFPMDGYVVYATGGVSVYLHDNGVVFMVVYGE